MSGYSFEGYLVNGSKDIGRHAVYCYVVWVCAMQLLLDACCCIPSCLPPHGG